MYSNPRKYLILLTLRLGKGRIPFPSLSVQQGFHGRCVPFREVPPLQARAGESLPEALCSPLSNRCHQSSEGRDARQENPPFSKPLPSRLEEHPRPISSIPGAPLQPRFELGASFRKLPIAVETLDLGPCVPGGFGRAQRTGRDCSHLGDPAVPRCRRKPPRVRP